MESTPAPRPRAEAPLAETLSAGALLAGAPSAETVDTAISESATGNDVAAAPANADPFADVMGMAP